MNIKTYMNFYANNAWESFLNSGFSAITPEEGDNYLWDIVKRTYYHWNIRQPVFIYGSTGIGKNYTIKELALANRNAKILYVSNRVSLDNHMKIEVFKALNMEKELAMYTREGIKNIEKVGNITFLTYAKFLYRDLEDFTYCFFDEVHAIYNDASYNAYTYKILKKMVKAPGVHIYQTATPFNIFPILYEKECARFYDNAVNVINHNTFGAIYYEFIKYKEYKLKFFSDWTDLIKIAKKSTDQWLIFIKSKEFGGLLKKILSDNGCTAEFISSDNKDESIEFDNIVIDSRFKAQYLLCTRVLDNGIDLKSMDALKNIVICEFDREEVLQMVGRARDLNVKASTIYCKLLTIEDINNEISYANLQLKKIRELNNVKNLDLFLSFCINDSDPNKIKDTKRLFYVDDLGKVKTNPLAVTYFKEKIRLLEILKNAEQPEYDSALFYLSWFYPYKKEWTVYEDDVIGEKIRKSKRRDAVECYLAKYLDSEIPVASEEQRLFTSQFTEIVKQNYDVKVSQNHPVWGRNNINKFLEANDFEYKIVMNSGYWRVISVVKEE